MESLDAMSREEELARKLVSAYGLTISYCDGIEASVGWFIRVQDTSSRQYVKFRNWHDLLFCDDRSGGAMSLNDFVQIYLNSSESSTRDIIQYASLDELDIQLTLMGRNPG